MKTLIFIIFLSIFALISCNEKVVIQNKDNEILISSITYSVNPSNCNNPYDSIGYYHNEGLEYIINNASSFTCDSVVLKNELRSLVDTFLVNNDDYTPSYLDMSLPGNYYDDFWDNTRFYDFDEMMNFYSINANVKAGAEKIIDYVKLLDSNYSVTEILDSIKTYETDVINSILTSYEKEQILKAASVGRYSLVYWNDIVEGGTSDWLGFLNCEYSNQNGGKGNISFFEGYSDTDKIIAVVAADVAGTVCCGFNVGAGIVYSSVTAIVAWWDDIINALESFWDWLF